MAERTLLEIFMIAVAVAGASFSGWLVFDGLRSLFPTLAELDPILKVIIGLSLITLLVKLGLRRQPL